MVLSNKELMNSFRSSRRMTEKMTPQNNKDRRRGNNGKKTPYDSFLEKYDRLEEYIDSFKTRDFVYYFREVAGECGVKYTIANIKKDMAIFKRLSDNYSPREICGMIEFLFHSNQDYLDKNKLSPNLLASRWVNTIYADTQLWVEDKYIPQSNKKNKRQREWDSEVPDETKTEIGEWE